MVDPVLVRERVPGPRGPQSAGLCYVSTGENPDAAGA